MNQLTFFAHKAEVENFEDCLQELNQHGIFPDRYQPTWTSSRQCMGTILIYYPPENEMIYLSECYQRQWLNTWEGNAIPLFADYPMEANELIRYNFAWVAATGSELIETNVVRIFYERFRQILIEKDI